MILISHPFFITTLTSYEQYCKPHGISFGMKNLNMYYTHEVHYIGLTMIQIRVETF
jgi:hypothetical protein